MPYAHRRCRSPHCTSMIASCRAFARLAFRARVAHISRATAYRYHAGLRRTRLYTARAARRARQRRRGAKAAGGACYTPHLVDAPQVGATALLSCLPPALLLPRATTYHNAVALRHATILPTYARTTPAACPQHAHHHLARRRTAAAAGRRGRRALRHIQPPWRAVSRTSAARCILSVRTSVSGVQA